MRHVKAFKFIGPFIDVDNAQKLGFSIASASWLHDTFNTIYEDCQVESIWYSQKAVFPYSNRIFISGKRVASRQILSISMSYPNIPFLKMIYVRSYLTFKVICHWRNEVNIFIWGHRSLYWKIIPRRFIKNLVLIVPDYKEEDLNCFNRLSKRDLAMLFLPVVPRSLVKNSLVQRFHGVKKPSAINRKFETRRILFLGDIFEFNSDDIFREFVSENVNKNFFRIIVVGKQSKDLSNFYENSEVEFKGFLSESELKEILISCDFALNPRNPFDPNTESNFPSKLLMYFSMSMLVISTHTKGLGSIVSDLLDCENVTSGKQLYEKAEYFYNLSLAEKLLRIEKQHAFLKSEAEHFELFVQSRFSC